MSRFSIVSVLGFSFFVSLPLIGMKKQQVNFKYSNPYFNLELQKSLTLIMLKNRNAKEVIDIDKDTLKVIAKNSYDLYCDSLPQYKEDEVKYFEWIINNKTRFIEYYHDTKIDLQSPAVVMMNDEGRRILMNLPMHVKMYGGSVDESNKPVPVYRVIFFNNDHRSHIPISYLRREDYLMLDDYQKVLNLPENLRSAVGVLCTLPVLKVRRGILASIKYWLGQGQLLDIVKKPLVPEKYEDAIELKRIIDANKHQQFKQLPMQVKEKVKLACVNLRDRE